MNGRHPSKIVVVGASMTGLRTAQGLRRAGYRGELVLVGAEAYLPYDRPPLSKQLLSSDRTWERKSLTDESSLARDDIAWLAGDAATAFDPVGRTVTLASGRRLGYDDLVVATGARPRSRPPSLAISGIHELRTVDDALAILDAFNRNAPVAVVGAGFIGTEVAAAARRRGLPVTLLDASPTPLRAHIGRPVADAILALHRARGVDVRLGRTVRATIGTGRVEALELDDGQQVSAEVVVVGVGVRAATDWMDGHGVDVTGGVPCDASGRAPWSGVWAVGDAASWIRGDGGTPLRCEHWTNGAEQAAVVAHNLLNAHTQLRTHLPSGYFWTDQYDVKVQHVGWISAADESVVIENAEQPERFASASTRAGQVTAATAYNWPGAFPHLRAAVKSGSNVQDLRARLR